MGEKKGNRKNVSDKSKSKVITYLLIRKSASHSPDKCPLCFLKVLCVCVSIVEV